VLSYEERELLSETEFALILHTSDGQFLKKFPVSDASSTWLSSEYFAKTAEQLPFVAQKIAASYLSRACALHNIPVSDTLKKLASSEIRDNVYHEVRDFSKTAAPVMETVAIVPDQSEHFYALGDNYAMPSADYVKKASVYFEDHYREFEDAEDRHTFAHNVLERAKELGVSLEDKEQLSKYASNQYGDSLETQIRLRKSLVEIKPEFDRALDKLAAHKDSTDAVTFARALYLFDKKAGLTRYYDRYLADAFKSTFGHFHKTAGYLWSDDASGLSINDKELTSAMNNKYDRIKSFFGETLADSLKKHGSTIFESLPNDAKETIVKIARGVI
jgi:hypothetical protein